MGLVRATSIGSMFISVALFGYCLVDMRSEIGKIPVGTQCQVDWLLVRIGAASGLAFWAGLIAGVACICLAHRRSVAYLWGLACAVIGILPFLLIPAVLHAMLDSRGLTLIDR